MSKYIETDSPSVYANIAACGGGLYAVEILRVKEGFTDFYKKPVSYAKLLQLLAFWGLRIDTDQIPNNTDAEFNSQIWESYNNTENKSYHTNTTGEIYFIQCGQMIKIGYTSAGARERLKSLQTGSPYPLKLLLTISGTYGDEQSHHGRFSKYHSHLEWFKFSKEIKSFIQAQKTEET